MNDEPAFPRNHRHEGHNGLTMRDYFAAKVCAAMLTTTSADRDLPNLGYRRGGDGPSVEERISEISYQMADAMLEARATPPTKEPTP